VHATIEAIVKKFGHGPDILCNNAGGGERKWFDHGREGEWETVDVWRRYVDLNLNSVHIVTRETAPRMKSGAAICNTSSIAGMLASPFLAAYAAAKAGVISYTKTCALQLGPKGIRVNAVAPGLIYTRVWENLGAALGGGDARARATFEASVRNSVPLGTNAGGYRSRSLVAVLRSGQECDRTGYRGGRRNRARRGRIGTPRIGGLFSGRNRARRSSPIDLMLEAAG